MKSRALAFSLGLSLLVPSILVAQQQHLNIPQRGGMPGQPVMTEVLPATNGVIVTWDGPAGYYQLFKRGSENEPWVALGERTNLNRFELVGTEDATAQFKVFGPAPHYGGARNCAECHTSIYENVGATSHAMGLEVLKPANRAESPACLPCHVVGFGLATGFTTEAQTPHLAGVQCESCHGPAGNHAANPEDFVAKPRVELASTMCGGCHNFHYPTYNQWKGSSHAVVTEDMNPAGRISSCGRCHSGSARLALLEGDPLPIGDANVGITCAVCHEPHDNTPHPAQLRNPLASMENYSLGTSDDFSAKYNPNINICAQCHNERGASWTSSARPPHHSPQYNMLIGTTGLRADAEKPSNPSAHAGLQKQCVSCHMQGDLDSRGREHVGHTFHVESYDSCRSCHPLPELLTQFTMGAVANRIQVVKSALDVWATTKAPETLRTKYANRAWEYTNVGSLSSGGLGPAAAEQAQIPDNIKRARYNVYLVLYDGSFGVHNGPHALTLLDDALSWIQTEMNQ